MQNHATIIVAHPDSKSTCAQIATALHKEFAQKSTATLIDLYHEGFDPILPYAELRRGFSFSPSIQRHQKILQNTETLLLVFPLWWGMPPAILKGWFDRVFSVEFAYTLNDGVLHGMLSHIQAGICFTYHEQNAEELKCIHEHMRLFIHKTGIRLHHCESIVVHRALGNKRITEIAHRALAAFAI